MAVLDVHSTCSTAMQFSPWHDYTIRNYLEAGQWVPLGRPLTCLEIIPM